MGKYSNIDSYESFRLVEKIIERDFRAGKITRERASQVLRDARSNYKNQNYNRQVEQLNKTERRNN